MTHRAMVTGQQFTFTLDEESELSRHALEVRCLLRRMPLGWRVKVVTEVTLMHKTIAGALARAERATVDPLQRGLPLTTPNPS